MMTVIGCRCRMRFRNVTEENLTGAILTDATICSTRRQTIRSETTTASPALRITFPGPRMFGREQLML